MGGRKESLFYKRLLRTYTGACGLTLSVFLSQLEDCRPSELARKSDYSTAPIADCEIAKGSFLLSLRLRKSSPLIEMILQLSR